MAPTMTAARVKSLKEPGRHSAGDNLYLLISPNGGKRWTFLYRWNGKRHEMGLGSAADDGVSLAEARRKAAEARDALRKGESPLKVKAASETQIPSFGAFADGYISDHKSKFKNAKHIAQWESTLSDAYCKAIRALPVNEVDTAAMLKVLQPIWRKIPETAARLRGRIENIIDAAKARGIYQGENPARWKGHLKSILPARQKLTRGHHAALPYDDLPGFMAELRKRPALAALALETCILTATRTSEVLAAQWQEIDLDKALWTIPAERMKAGKEHRVPLCKRVVKVLKALPRLSHNDHVFPGNKKGKPLSNMAMTKVLERMGYDSITVHGFRSTFKDWATEMTSFANDTSEAALAHVIKDKAEAAYKRTDQLEKRRKLMEAWEAFCSTTGRGKVIPIRGGRRNA